FNDGSGRLTSEGSLPAGRCRRFVLVDVDGDLDLDAVGIPGSISHYTSPGNVSLALNDGSGRFTDASTRLPAALVAGLECAVVDLDGDRAPEIVIITDGQPLPLLVWRNDGKGNFTDVTPTAVVGQMPTATTFGAATDID